MNIRKSLASVAVLPPLFMIAGCGGSSSEQRREPPSNSEIASQRSVAVRVRRVVPEPFAETLRLTGYAKAVEDVVVSTEEGGILKEWSVAKGGTVRRGAVLATMKDDILLATHEAAQAQLKLAELNYERQKVVFAEQGISELQFKTSEYNRDAAKAQADLARARWERTRIVSPVDGVLDDRFVDEGELAPPGSPVARVVNLGSMKVVLNIPERYAGSVSRGSRVRFTVDAAPGETFSGSVVFVGSAVLADNRTLPMEVRIPNAGGRIKPDMIVRATVIQSTPRDALQVEESLIQQVDQKTFVVFVVEGGKAVKRVVRPGGRGDDRMEILEGLDVGDSLIVSGNQNVLDGQQVSVEPQ